MFKIFAPVAGLFFALLALEIFIRVSSLTISQATPWNDRPRFYFAAEGRPTMQGFDYLAEKPENTFRIAVIGDSFTFAPYMQFTDTFATKLEQMLNLNHTTRKAEVINYGVPAYSTSHEVNVVEKAIKERADLILLQVTLNDPEVKGHTPTGIRENMDDRFAPLKVSSFWKTLDFVRTRLHNSKTHSAYREYFLDLFENPRSWNPYKAATTRITQLAKTAEIPIVAVVFPLFGLPLDSRYPFYPIHQKVKALFEELQTPNFDLSEIYKGIPLERLQVIPGGDRHPNEIAHRMAAEEIYLKLEELKLLPQELLIKSKYRTRLGISGQKQL